MQMSEKMRNLYEYVERNRRIADDFVYLLVTLSITPRFVVSVCLSVCLALHRIMLKKE